MKNRKFFEGLFLRLVDGVPCKIMSMAFQSGQNCQQFSWSKPVPISWSNTYFYGQNSHFCVKTDFLTYLGHKISWSISIPFQSQNFMLNPIPFQFLCSTPLDWRASLKYQTGKSLKRANRLSSDLLSSLSETVSQASTIRAEAITTIQSRKKMS